MGVLYLFFVPNSSLFNITYVNNHEKIISEQYNKNDITTICLNSRAYDVSVLPSENDNYYVELYSNTFGFTLTKNEKIAVQSSLKDQVLTFNIKESYGFAFENSSYIKLFIPDGTAPNLSFNNLKATTVINHPSLTINNLNYSTTNGDFSFKQGSILGNLDLSIDKSTFTISKAVKTTNEVDNTTYNNVTLSMSTGKFLAENETLGNVLVKNSTRGVVNINECSRYEQNTETAGGQINLNKVGSASITSGDTIINIKESSQGLNINLKNAGEINIEKLNEAALSTFSTKEGAINISNCSASVTAHSDSGNINIYNAMKTVSVRTNYGNVNVQFIASEAGESTNVLYATIYNGYLNASGVEHIGDDASDDDLVQGVTVTGNGRVNLLMNNVVGKNVIKGKNGNIYVEIKDSAVYDLSTQSQSGNVRVNLLQLSEFGGYTTSSQKTTHVNHNEATNCGVENSLEVSSNQGDITILDSIIASRGF